MLHKFILFLISFLVFILVFSLPLALTAQNSNQKTFNYGYISGFLKSGNGQLAIGDLETNTNNRFSVTTIDSAFNIRWIKSYRDIIEFYSHANNIVALDSERFLVAGMTYNDTISNQEISLIKIDSSGSIVWSKRFGNPFEDDESFGLIADTSGYTLSGYSNGFGEGRKDIYIIRTDTAGVISWSNTFGTSSEEDAKSLFRFQNGWMTAISIIDSASGKENIGILVIDSMGHLKDKVAFATGGNEKLLSILPTFDHGFMLAANRYPSNELVLVKMDSTFHVSSASRYSNTNFSSANLTFHGDGNYYLSATSNHSLFTTAVLMAIDTTGMVIYSKEFSPMYNSGFQSLISCDSFLMVGGFYSTSTAVDPFNYLLRYYPSDTTGICNTDSLPITKTIISNYDAGRYQPALRENSIITPEYNSVVFPTSVVVNAAFLCDSASFIPETNKMELIIAPNPADEYLEVETRFPSLIQLSNGLGKVIFSDKMPERFRINISSYPSGVYILSTLSGRRTGHSKIMISH